MLAQSFIQKELRLINEMYFAIHNPEVNRWQIRKWYGIYPKSLSLWKECSENILTIRKEEVSDDGLQDVGYENIDMRVIHAIRESHWWKLKWKQKVAEMDLRNEKKSNSLVEQFGYESKYAAKRVWRAMHEPTVNLPGKEWRT